MLARVVVVVCGFAVAGCAGGSPNASPPTTIRPINGLAAVHCSQGQVVEQGPNYLYGCVSPSPAQPTSNAPQVQQGDRCSEFGATTFNAQGKVFDCEPGNGGVDRWILP